MKIEIELTSKQLLSLRTLLKSAIADGRPFERLEGPAFVAAAHGHVKAGGIGAVERDRASRFLGIYEQISACPAVSGKPREAHQGGQK